MLKIYGFDGSTWSNRVRFTANSLGLEYDYVTVNLLAGEGQTKDYLAIHPAGKVPAIDDEGFILFESGAITRYLADKAGSSIYPSDLRKRARVEQWTEFAAQHIAKAMERVFFNRVLYQVMNMEQDERSLQEGLKFMDRFLPLVNDQLEKYRHFAMDDLTLADFVLLAWLDPVELCDIDLSAYPKLTEWRKRLMQQDFYTRCYSSYRERFQSLAA
ncbi:MAG: glutathione S-transferase family protein [Methylococcaceae bacterium]|nr:glutathione S-transferase family protein [Methylococcaceae bacterium]MCI0667330.1 glutathione S-transferase family protein [Methylococcaceae bacterium]MCI0734085.1 glutathione S-transferase family protein [Methylococcaceae bacterium]